MWYINWWRIKRVQTYQEHNRWVANNSNSSAQLPLVATTAAKKKRSHTSPHGSHQLYNILHSTVQTPPIKARYLYFPQRLSACMLRSSLVISFSTTSLIWSSGTPRMRANIVRSSRPVRYSIKESNCITDDEKLSPNTPLLIQVMVLIVTIALEWDHSSSNRVWT